MVYKRYFFVVSSEDMTADECKAEARRYHKLADEAERLARQYTNEKWDNECERRVVLSQIDEKEKELSKLNIKNVC